MANVQQLTTPVEGIITHAWNGNKTMLAISPNSNEIHIYETKNWTRLYVLAEHDLLVSSIDWSPVTNKIVSCSHDRNAFVWTFEPESNTWKPALVILRIDRAALDVKWSHDGLRFAVASGSKCVPVCTYEHSNDWWVCKMVKKKFKSTVLCCSFHPSNGQLLATGSSDFKCRIYSTFTSDVDNEVNPGPFTSTLGPLEFGEAYVELTALGWVHAVAWSPSGNVIAYASHASHVHFANLTESAEPTVRTVRLNDLPMLNLLFLNEGVLAGAGFDFNPALFTYSKSTGQWSFHSRVDREESTGSTDAAETSNVSRARELFRNKTVRGQDLKADTDTLKTKHERAITSLRDATTGGNNGKITHLSSTGLDGKLVIWNLPSIELQFANLGI